MNKLLIILFFLIGVSCNLFKTTTITLVNETPHFIDSAVITLNLKKIKINNIPPGFDTLITTDKISGRDIVIYSNIYKNNFIADKYFYFDDLG